MESNAVNHSEGLYDCPDRVSPGDQPRNITAIADKYLPFDPTNSTVHIRSSLFGAQIYKKDVKAGNVHDAHDGKRLILEVGCTTVIYVLINQKNPQTHHRIFIQSESGFNYDTTIRLDSAKTVHNTRHIETIVKYELYFVLGVLSTTSLGAWLAVTGSDVTVMAARNKAKSDAANRCAKKLLKEMAEIKKYAPTLHKNIMSIVEVEVKNNAKRGVRELPEAIVTSEKVQAQVAGILFGKWLASAQTFSAWTMISTVLIQAGANSITKYPKAIHTALDHRYKPLIDAVRGVDPNNPKSLGDASRAFVKFSKEAGITISEQDAKKILEEVARNPKRSASNLTNIINAIDHFRREMA